MPTDLPTELPADPIHAARILTALHSELTADARRRHPRLSEVLIATKFVGWTAPDRAAASPAPPSTFLPDDGWGASGPQVSSDIVSAALALDGRLGAALRVAEDASAPAASSRRARAEMEALRPLLAALSAEIPLSAASWLPEMASERSVRRPTAPNRLPTTPLRPRR